MQASTLTFGPFGRVVCTLLLVFPPIFFVVYGGLFGIVGAALWCARILPGGLRDTWRRAALASTELTRLRDETARQLAEQRRHRATHVALDQDQDGTLPTRW